MKNNKSKFILLISILLLGFIYKSIEKKSHSINEENYPVWIDMMEQPSVNLEEARTAFDTYWQHNTHFKGDRSKQFERWYTRNSKRLDAYGNVVPYTHIISEFQKMRSSLAFEQKGQWYNYGPVNVGRKTNGDPKNGGRVKDIEFHPTDPNTYYVSTFKGGLFKTTDEGNTWIPITDHLPEQVFISKVLPSNPTTIFIGTNAGVLKSTDAGANWSSNLSGLPSNSTNALLIKPDNESIIIAGNNTGIYRSTNGGTSFTQVQSASKVSELRVHPTNPDIMYAGTNGTTSQFFRSSDGGITWVENTTDFGQGAFMKIAVTPAQPNYVYVINSRDHLDQDSFEGVYQSTDSGVTFTKQSGGTPCITGYSDSGSISRGQPNYNLFIVADPNNADILYAGGVKSWKSIDGGVNWTQVFNNVTADGYGLHLDQLTWAYSPLTDRLFAVNDGGIWYLNSDDKFQNITDGLPIAEVWECTQSQQNPTNVAGGTFHCGVKLNRDGVWYSQWGGDESTVLFDYSDDTYAYHFKYEKISRSVNGGLTFQRINSSSADRGEYTGTGVLDKSDVNTLFVGLFEVERINNARTATSSTAWTKISSFGGSTKIKKIEQSDANHNILYVSRGSGSFYRSDDVRTASPSFINLTSNLQGSGTINDIATHPTDENLVYILRGSKVYKSTDKGETWTDISNGLPSIPLLEMVYDSSSDEGIYIGTDLGVYYKDATLSNWIDYSNGLPAIRVSGMDIYYGATREDSFLTVSTDGRGFWRTALNDISLPAPTVNFNSDKAEVFKDGQVQFTNESSNVPVGSFIWTFEGGTPATSLEENPIVTYNTEGTFAVTLSYTTDSGIETKSVANYITVIPLPAPVADFTVDSQTVSEGNLINFTDSSLNEPASWNWTFEGGTPANSTDQNPSITYNTIGTYKVSLTVTNNTGSDTKEVVDYITVTENMGSGTLQAHYNFDENLNDDSSYGRNLSVIGGFTPTYVDDHNANPNSAYHSPGASNNYLTNGYKSIGADGERTVTAWIKTTAAGSRKTIVSWGTNSSGQMFNVMVENGNIRVEGGSCNVQNDDSSVARLDGNTWRHIAVTYDPADGDKASDVKLYIDGVFYANQPDSGDSFNSEATVINTDNTINNLQVGNANYNANYYWQGDLDDVRIYSEALTEQEIQDIMNDAPPVPPIADFSANVTTILQGDEVSFTDNSSGSPTTWSWIFIGADTESSNEENPTISYSTAGTYTVSLTVTNSEGSDTKTITDYITVNTPPPPVANFSADKTIIWEGEQVSYTDTSTNNPTSWAWTFEGGTPDTSTDQNPTITYNTEGSYKVILEATNIQGSDSKEIVDYITVKKPLDVNLSIDNYTVSSTSETCRNSNNGKINIIPKADYPYNAIITGEGFNQTSSFSLASPLNLENLLAGTYSICITIDEAPYYEQCFTVVINEPENLSVFSKVNNSKNTVSLELSGASSYTISLNKTEIVTTKSKVILNLQPNIANDLKVSTNKTCQGLYQETIILSGKDLFYPNPTSNELNILLGSMMENNKEAKVSIYTSLGRLVRIQKYPSANQKIKLDTSDLPKGSYIVSVEVGENFINHKMIKQ
ncbi:PKD domain-containing protein [Sabulilitoribacter arenilitoris]|uniref:PKD domain-containing protein n=1 Tax=Wocania arenilitoris TaxID=2044858 RepID=A0AAE3ELJ7_9FLAO|nr:PKD domain-containing protein [Wocania arenilitoris]MCF7567635.1 PKD domain-containing protein [Wocania arenilitoris]